MSDVPVDPDLPFVRSAIVAWVEADDSRPVIPGAKYPRARRAAQEWPPGSVAYEYHALVVRTIVGRVREELVEGNYHDAAAFLDELLGGDA